MENQSKLTWVKIIHTAIWIFFNMVIFYMLYATLADKLDLWLWIGFALVCLEGLTLLLFKLYCPLTLIARRYSSSTRDNFDIYLPNWLARHTKRIYTSLVIFQELNAGRALEKLRGLIELKHDLLREGKAVQVPTLELLPGDILTLNAGDVIPADCRIIESNELHVNEAALTGESFPAEKEVGQIDDHKTLHVPGPGHPYRRKYFIWPVDAKPGQNYRNCF